MIYEISLLRVQILIWYVLELKGTLELEGKIRFTIDVYGFCIAQKLAFTSN